jgi:hypothetical protein
MREHVELFPLGERFENSDRKRPLTEDGLRAMVPVIVFVTVKGCGDEE